MGSSGETSPPDPGNANNPAEFVAALRALRTWSGLTYRQLEGKAATYRDALPASTIATTLGRATLPRDRFVDTFTRACGLGDDDVRGWLDARTRLAVADPAQAPDEDPEPPRWRRFVWPVAAGLTGVAVGVAGTLLVSDDPVTPEPEYVAIPEKPVAGLDMLAVGSWARIHPAGSTELCVTEGIDRSGKYETAVATQQPCEKVEFPRVYVEPLAENVVQIQWHHPEFEIGCLTVMVEGAGKDMLEPRDKCAADDPAQRFRLERTGTRYVIRPEVSHQCLRLRDGEEGAEVVQGSCADGQEFEIELVKPAG